MSESELFEIMKSSLLVGWCMQEWDRLFKQREEENKAKADFEKKIKSKRSEIGGMYEK